MGVYYIAEVTIHDPDKYVIIREQSNELIRRYRGKVLAADSEFQAIEGDFPSTRIIVIEFPSREDFENWYGCPEYEKLKKVRDEAADARIAIVHGL